jgi:hypothetical protein
MSEFSLPSAKQLDAIFKVCRRQGVDTIEVGSLKVKFGDLPRKAGSAEDAEQETLPDGTVLPPGVTADQMAFYSSQPDPLAEIGAEQ